MVDLERQLVAVAAEPRRPKTAPALLTSTSIRGQRSSSRSASARTSSSDAKSARWGSRGADPPRDPAQAPLVTADRDHRGTAARQLGGGGLADPGAGAGDDDDATLEVRPAYSS